MNIRLDQLCDGTRQKGFALIAVIWIGILLALMGAAFSSAVRSRIRATAVRADTVRAEALADAGVRIALIDMLNRGAGSSAQQMFASDGTPVVCAIGQDAAVVIQVEDEEGKVNLNTNNVNLLTALFAGLGASRSRARGYAERIMDFRDRDDDKRESGAEREDYVKGAAGSAGPKNADFASVDELDQVLEVPADIREKAKPFLAAFSSQDGFDISVAPRGLKEILVRGSNGIVAVGTGATSGESAFQISSDLPREFLANSLRRAYAIRAEAILLSGARFVSDAVVGLPSSEAGIPIFRYWRRGRSHWPEAQILPSPKDLRPC